MLDYHLARYTSYTPSRILQPCALLTWIESDVKEREIEILAMSRHIFNFHLNKSYKY